jgi:hypothetical protein
MVKNRHFLPFFGPKTPFFAIFWHPVYPPSKTPFLAVLPPQSRERPPGPERHFQPFPATSATEREVYDFKKTLFFYDGAKALATQKEEENFWVKWSLREHHHPTV